MTSYIQIGKALKKVKFGLLAKPPVTPPPPPNFGDFVVFKHS